jgi:NHS family xanthosine MFS transporter
MWVTDLCGWTPNANQLLFAGISSIALSLYAFMLPACKPGKQTATSILSAIGLDALMLFKQRTMLIFFFLQCVWVLHYK